MLCQYGVDPKEKYRLICFREEASVRPETALPPDICLAASISLPQGAFWLIREEERQRITAWLLSLIHILRNVYLGTPSGLGRATAEGVVLMVIILAITLIQFKLRRKKV